MPEPVAWLILGALIGGGVVAAYYRYRRPNRSVADAVKNLDATSAALQDATDSANQPPATTKE